LIELKKSIYDSVYLNKPFEKELEGFVLVEELRITNTIELDNNDDIKRRFMMTPYYYKTGKKDQEKLEHISSLKTTLDFMILIYKKI
jgi:23S rRNA (guanine745-N1)-methyltransferase